MSSSNPSIPISEVKELSNVCYDSRELSRVGTENAGDLSCSGLASIER
jgi:hypothetical protein